MRKFWFEGVMLGVALFCSISSTHAQNAPGIFEPDRGRIQLGVGYQYQHYHNVLGRSFHDHGYYADVSFHLFDAITGASARLAVAGEGTVAAGFGHAGGSPIVVSNSLFIGGGPRVSIVSSSRIEPWIHVLPGWQHFRFTQTAQGLGSNSAFGFMAGAGLDFKVAGPLFWRIQADYIGTNFRSTLQNNYSVGSGVSLYF
jgi:hypothetical protein